MPKQERSERFPHLTKYQEELAYMTREQVEEEAVRWRNAHGAIWAQTADLQKKTSNQAAHIIRIEAKLEEARAEQRRLQRERDAFRDRLTPEQRREALIEAEAF